MEKPCFACYGQQMDIMRGNFAQSPDAAPAELDEKWENAKYGLIIFKNQLYQPKK